MEERFDESRLEAAKAAHEALMSAYARAWDELSLLQSHREIVERLDLQPALGAVLPSLVRYLVVSHARRQLSELRAVYVRLQHAPPLAVSARKGRIWLQEAAADVSAFLEALPRRELLWDVLLSGLTLVPVSALAWLFRAGMTIDARYFALLGLGAVIGVALGWALSTIYESFEAKRRLFGAPVVGQRPGRRTSIYEREDRLFSALGRAKRKELAVDTIVSIATLVVAAGFCLASAVNGFRMHNIGVGIFLVVAAGLFLVGAVRSAQRARQRLPH